nr:YppG family protein [Metabacillus lacus]
MQQFYQPYHEGVPYSPFYQVPMNPYPQNPQQQNIFAPPGQFPFFQQNIDYIQNGGAPNQHAFQSGGAPGQQGFQIGGFPQQPGIFGQQPGVYNQQPAAYNQQAGAFNQAGYFPNPYPKPMPFMKPQSPGFQSIMSQFKNKNGQYDMNKMMDTAGQMMSAVNQMGSLMKGVTSIFKV